MSVRTFTRRFREETGVSPGQWLTRQRVERARYLLETTELTVDQVARDAGFGTAQSMRAHLQAALGVTPTAYRRTFRAGSTREEGRRSRSEFRTRPLVHRLWTDRRGGGAALLAPSTAAPHRPSSPAAPPGPRAREAHAGSRPTLAEGPVAAPSPSPHGESLTTRVITRSRRVNTISRVDTAFAAIALFVGSAHGSTSGAPHHARHRSAVAPCTRASPKARQPSGRGALRPPRTPARRTSPRCRRRRRGRRRTRRRSGRVRTRCVCRRPRWSSPSGRRDRRRGRVRARRSPRRPRSAARGAAAAVGDLQADGDLLGRVRAGQRESQDGRTARVHHGVGDQFGDEQDQRLGQRFVGPYAGPGQP